MAQQLYWIALDCRGVTNNYYRVQSGDSFGFSYSITLRRKWIHIRKSLKHLF